MTLDVHWRNTPGSPPASVLSRYTIYLTCPVNTSLLVAPKCRISKDIFVLGIARPYCIKLKQIFQNDSLGTWSICGIFQNGKFTDLKTRQCIITFFKSPWWCFICRSPLVLKGGGGKGRADIQINETQLSAASWKNNCKDIFHLSVFKLTLCRNHARSHSARMTTMRSIEHILSHFFIYQNM